MGHTAYFLLLSAVKLLLTVSVLMHQQYFVRDSIRRSHIRRHYSIPVRSAGFPAQKCHPGSSGRFPTQKQKKEPAVYTAELSVFRGFHPYPVAPNRLQTVSGSGTEKRIHPYCTGGFLSPCRMPVLRHDGRRNSAGTKILTGYPQAMFLSEIQCTSEGIPAPPRMPFQKFPVLFPVKPCIPRHGHREQ